MPPEMFGKFELLQPIGRGGMGVVHRARDTTLGREVALKTLQGLSDPDALARFQREAQLAARLRHPGIVAIYEAGVEKGVPYIAMEYVRGRGLDEVLAGPLRTRERVELIRRVAEAVHAAHEQGVVHRDLKPSNILVDEDGRPRVADFGIAHDVRGATLTASGMLVGSPPYMSPEQARGDSTRVDRRTDVYALGVILYEALARRRPLEDTDVPRLLSRIVGEEPEPPSRHQSGVDAKLDRICLKALAKRAEDRYASAKAFSEDLTRWLAGLSIHAERPPIARRLANLVHRHATLFVAGVAAAVAGIGVWLAVAPRSGRLSFETFPAGARVEVDGRVVERPPVTLAPGDHLVRVTRDGCREFSDTITVRAGETLVRRFELARAVASLSVQPGGFVRVRVIGPGVDAEADAPWTHDALAPGRYEVVLSGPDHPRAVASVELAGGDRRMLTPALAWRARIGKIDHTPAVADLNGDGVQDVAVLADPPRLYALSGADGRVLWQQNVGGSPQRGPALVHADADEVPDVAVGVAGANGGGLFVFSGGSGEPLVVEMMSAGVRTSDSLAARHAVFAASVNGTLIRLRPPRALLWRSPHPASVEAAPLWTVLDGRECVLLATSGGVCRHDAETGTEQGRLEMASRPASELCLADVDADGRPEAVLGCHDGSVVCFDPLALTARWTQKATDKRILTRPAADDVDGDGAVDVVVGSDDGHVFCLEGRTGAIKWRFKTGHSVHAAPAIGDVDGDGRADVVAGSDDDRVWVLDGRTGRPAWRFECGDDIDAGLRIVDLDRDGAPEIVACSNDGYVYVLRLARKR